MVGGRRRGSRHTLKQEDLTGYMEENKKNKCVRIIKQWSR